MPIIGAAALLVLVAAWFRTAWRRAGQVISDASADRWDSSGLEEYEQFRERR